MPGQLSVESEWEAQGERHGDHELSQRYVRQNVVDEVERTLINAQAEAARAHGPGLAAEGDYVELAAGVAIEVCEGPRENSAVELLVQLFGHELGKRPPAGIVGPLLL